MCTVSLPSARAEVICTRIVTVLRDETVLCQKWWEQQNSVASFGLWGRSKKTGLSDYSEYVGNSRFNTQPLLFSSLLFSSLLFSSLLFSAHLSMAIARGLRLLAVPRLNDSKNEGEICGLAHVFAPRWLERILGQPVFSEVSTVNQPIASKMDRHLQAHLRVLCLRTFFASERGREAHSRDAHQRELVRVERELVCKTDFVQRHTVLTRLWDAEKQPRLIQNRRLFSAKTMCGRDRILLREARENGRSNILATGFARRASGRIVGTVSA